MNKRQRISYTNEEIKAAALQCKTHKEFRTKFYHHWQQSRNRKILHIIGAHLIKEAPKRAPILPRYGTLNVDINNSKTINGHLYVWTECDCGRTSKYTAAQHLRKGKTTTCHKCAHSLSAQDFTGKKFGNRTVIGTEIIRSDTAHRRPHMLVECICKRVDWVDISGLQRGSANTCAVCTQSVSKAQEEIYNYVKSLGFVDAVLSDRTYGFEIDVLVPSKNFFIEFDGLYWHSTQSPRKNISEASEKKRYKKFQQTGLAGFRIFEDEWAKNEVLVKNMIAAKLGVRPTRSFDMQFKFIENPKLYKDFFTNNHIQGYSNCSVAFGAFNGTDLISCMSFKKVIQGKYKGQIELARFCNAQGVNTYGAFGKLLKLAKTHFKQLGYTHIISFSENRLSNGNVYKNNGFVLDHVTDRLDYFYTAPSRLIRLHRQTCQKLHPPQISQEEYDAAPTESLQAITGVMAKVKIGANIPLYRIWGWGNTLWVRAL